MTQPEKHLKTRYLFSDKDQLFKDGKLQALDPRPNLRAPARLTIPHVRIQAALDQPDNRAISA